MLEAFLRLKAKWLGGLRHDLVVFVEDGMNFGTFFAASGDDWIDHNNLGVCQSLFPRR
jgi:hypothetical protein